jgi:hypothetical protein
MQKCLNNKSVSTVLVITALEPNPENIGGPTGLIFEFIQSLNDKGLNVVVEVIRPKGLIQMAMLKSYSFIPFNRLNELKKIAVESDLIIIYPSWLYMLAFVLSTKTTVAVLCPDFSSGTIAKLMLAKAKEFNVIGALRLLWATIFSVILELVSDRFFGVKSVVVSDRDKQKLEAISGNRSVLYMVHPFFSRQLVDLQLMAKRSSNAIDKKILRVVVYGDYKYSKSSHLWGEIFEALGSSEVSQHIFLDVYSKQNEFVVQLASKYGVRCRMTPRFERFSDIYHSWVVALLPIQTGGGAKTRTLMSLANGIPVLTLPHGIAGCEDLANNVFIFESSAELKNIMIKILEGSLPAGPDRAVAQSTRETRSANICCSQIIDMLFEIGQKTKKIYR